MHSTFATKALQLKTILKPKQQTWETFWKGWVNSQLCTPIAVWNHGHLYSERLEGQVSLPHCHPVKNCDHSNVSRTTSGEYLSASPKNKKKHFTSSFWGRSFFKTGLGHGAWWGDTLRLWTILIKKPVIFLHQHFFSSLFIKNLGVSFSSTVSSLQDSVFRKFRSKVSKDPTTLQEQDLLNSKKYSTTSLTIYIYI